MPRLFTGLEIPVEVGDASLVVVGKCLDKCVAFGFRIAVGDLAVFGVYHILEALVERKSGDERGFRGEAQKPKTGMAETQNEQADSRQRIHRNAPKRGNIHAHKEGCLQVAPHGFCILP